MRLPSYAVNNIRKVLLEIEMGEDRILLPLTDTDLERKFIEPIRIIIQEAEEKEIDNAL